MPARDTGRTDERDHALTRRVVRRQPHVAEDLHAALALLAEDVFHPQLRSHKLKGRFAGSWACSVGYDLRIVFRFVQHEDSEALLLVTVGTHDEVY